MPFLIFKSKLHKRNFSTVGKNLNFGVSKTSLEDLLHKYIILSMLIYSVYNGTLHADILEFSYPAVDGLFLETG